MRRVIGVLMVVDAALTVGFLWTLKSSAVSHPGAPWWLTGLGSNIPALLILGGLACVGAWRFVRSTREPVLPGLVALLSVGLLVEAQGALLEGPMRFLFFSGAALLGWLAGWLVARGRAVEERERFGDAGALGTLAACYLGAVTSKLLTSGVAWVTDSGLRSTIASQHHWGSSRALDALALFVLEHAGVAYALAAFTLVAQASAVLLPFSRRLRRVAVVLLLLFHTGVWLLTPISFPQAMVLLVAAAFVRDDAVTLRAGEVRRPLSVLAAGCALFVAVAWLPPVRAYTGKHHARVLRPLAEVQRAVEPPPEVVAVAGLPVGREVAGFRVGSLGKAGDGGCGWSAARSPSPSISCPGAGGPSSRR
jgi:hypothetical protein